jgi:hypothetical protein
VVFLQASQTQTQMDACRQNTARRFVVFRTSRDYVVDDDDDGEWEWEEVGVISRKTTGVGSEGTKEGRNLKIINQFF